MPDYAPAFGNGLTGYLDPAAMADPGWAAAYALLVEYLYEFYGDNRVWQDHYSHVAQYINFVVANSTDPETGLFTFSRFGDWCAFKWLPHTVENSGMGGCYGRSPLSSSFFYARQLSILQRAASRLGLAQDAVRWRDLLSNVTRAFKQAFMQPDGSFSDNADGRGTQAFMGSQALALAFPSARSINVSNSTAEKAEALLSTNERSIVGRALQSNVAAHGYHPYSGELSLTYLFDGLQEQGRPDIAVAMASNPSQPGCVLKQLYHAIL
jgi:alpha-L-rhamnosidase